MSHVRGDRYPGSMSGEGLDTQVLCPGGGGTYPCDLSHEVFDATYLLPPS